MRVLTGHNFLQGGHILAGHGASASADAIAALYSGAFADVGFYLPLNDRTYMWQEHTGETPVTSDNDTVGLVLDKSQGVRVTEDGGGNRTLTGLRDELVTNGGFDTDSDWTLGANTSISGGELVVSSVGAGFTSQSTSATVGKFYFCTMDVSATTGTVQINLGGTSSSAVSTGTHTFILQMGASHSQLRIAPQGGFTGTIDNVSVKEVPGNHAYQNTAASRPIWNATEEGVDFDGTDDYLLINTSARNIQFTLGTAVKTADTDFNVLSSQTDNGYFVGKALSGNTGVVSGNAVPRHYVDGVRIYNPTQDDLFDAVGDGSTHFYEARLTSVSADNVNWEALRIGDRTGVNRTDGILAPAYLTSNTSTSALDRARNYAANQEGITMRHTETLTDQVATGGVYGPSNDISNMFQDSAGTTPVTADQDPVGLVSNPVSGGADLTQTTAAARPLYDEASGLYDFDGTDDHFLADLTGIGDRSNMYFACVVNTTDISFITLASATNSSRFAGYVQSGLGSASFANAGSPSVYANGSFVSTVNTGTLYTAIATGSKVLVEFVGLDLSLAEWGSVSIAGRSSNSDYYLDGLAGEFVLIPNPGVVGRNIIRRDILARHPSITFAGA